MEPGTRCRIERAFRHGNGAGADRHSDQRMSVPRILKYWLIGLFAFYQQAAIGQVLLRMVPGYGPSAAVVQQAFAVPAGTAVRMESLKLNDQAPTFVNLDLRRFEVTDARTELVVHSDNGQQRTAIAPRAHFTGKIVGDEKSFVFVTLDNQGGMRSIVHSGDQVILNETLPATPDRAGDAS